MSPHRARELRVEVLRRTVEDRAREAARLLNEAKVAEAVIAPPEAVLAACAPGIVAAAVELGQALLSLAAYEAGRAPAPLRDPTGQRAPLLREVNEGRVKPHYLTRSKGAP